MEHEQEAGAGIDRQTIRRTDENQLSNGSQLARSSASAGRGEEAFASWGVLGDTRDSSNNAAPEAGAEGEQESLKLETLKAVQMLPSCPIDSRGYLPSASAIYFLMRGGECLYVGKSTNLRNRWNSHEKLMEVESIEGLRLAWQPMPEKQLDFVERKMIVALKPKFNYNLVPQPPKQGVIFPLKFAGMRQESKLLSTTEAAARVGLSVARIQTFVWEGRLPAVKVGRSYAIDEDDLRLIENRKTGRPPKPKASGPGGKVTVKTSKKKGGKK
jgi:excisionase family DNA binding protein